MQPGVFDHKSKVTPELALADYKVSCTSVQNFVHIIWAKFSSYLVGFAQVVEKGW